MAAGLLLSVAVALWLAQDAGRWLSVQDPLVHAGAIAVLNGDTPYRALEALALYRAGWASEVWLTQVPDHPEDPARVRRGEIGDLGTGANVTALTQAGVPAHAIHLLREPVASTADEISVILAELDRRRLGTIIIVTSKVHTRRAKTIWRRQAAAAVAIVRYATLGRYDPAQWWRREEDRRIVIHELLGLAAVSLGLRGPGVPGARRSGDPDSHLPKTGNR